MTTKPAKRRAPYTALITPELLARLAADFPQHGHAPTRPAIQHAPPPQHPTLQIPTQSGRMPTLSDLPKGDPSAAPPSGSADLLRHMPKEQLESARRCHYRDRAGRRCRRDRMHNHPTYCFFHARPEGESDLPPDSPQAVGNGSGPADTTLEDLLGPLQDYRTAAGVNFTLGRLLLLVADNRLSARKAHLIAYICQLLLQSVPAVAKEIGAATLDEDEREDLNRAIRATRFLFEPSASEEDSPEAPQTTSP